MHSAALIANPLALVVYAYRVELHQNGAAFSTNTDNRIETITAKHEFALVFRMPPKRNVFTIAADVTGFHRFSSQNNLIIIPCRTEVRKIHCLTLGMTYIIVNTSGNLLY
jgi:hypothetical protein